MLYHVFYAIFQCGSQKCRGGGRSHDAKLGGHPLSRNCRRHRCARRACRCRSSRRNHVPHDAELVANLLLLEGPRLTRQRRVPVRLGKEGCCLVGYGNCSRDAIVGGGRDKGVDFRARGRERGLVGFAEGLCKGSVGDLRVKEDGGGPAGGLRL